MKILSEGEFREFDGFEFMGNKPTCVLDFGDTKIECTEDHMFLRDDGEWVEAKDISSNDAYSNKHLVSFTKTNQIKPVYDAINVKNTHSFYAEGMTVHNCSFLYLDEVAFIEGYDEFFASVYPTISSGETTKLLMTSTPNGMNHFWKTCKGAEEGTNGYKFVKVMWNDVPGRDERWKQETLEALDHDQEKFNQEYCCQFMGSSGTLINGQKLKELSPEIPITQAEGLTQYNRPEEGRVYALIVDVSRGKGLDYSAFSVIDITRMPYRQVCTFRDNFIGSADYATVVHNVAKLYNEAYVLVEVNDNGAQVSDILYLDYGYENLVFTENAGRSGKRVSGGFRKNVDRGIRTTKTVKAVGCSVLKMLIEQNQLLIQDFNTIQELSRFSRKGRSYEAESGAHDDLVMGLVLFAWLSDQTYFRDLTDINTMAALREKTEEQIEEELLPFGFIMDGHDEEEVVGGVQTASWF
jgi:hypothetical protein